MGLQVYWYVLTLLCYYNPESQPANEMKKHPELDAQSTERPLSKTKTKKRELVNRFVVAILPLEPHKTNHCMFPSKIFRRPDWNENLPYLEVHGHLITPIIRLPITPLKDLGGFLKYSCTPPSR